MKGEQTKLATVSGLAGLYEVYQKNVADGKQIFDLVMQEKADANALAEIVYQESLSQLILYVLDHRKEVTSRVNQEKSAKQRTLAGSVDKAKVFDWCNTNRESAWFPYKSSVESAMAATNISARTSVRGYISDWRNSNPKG